MQPTKISLTYTQVYTVHHEKHYFQLYLTNIPCYQMELYREYHFCFLVKKKKSSFYLKCDILKYSEICQNQILIKSQMSLTQIYF